MIQQLVIQSKNRETLCSLSLFIKSTFFVCAREREQTTTLEVSLMEKDLPILMKELYRRGCSEEIIFYRKWFPLSQSPISSFEKSREEFLVDYFIEEEEFNEGYYDYLNEHWFVKSTNKSTIFLKKQYKKYDNILWAPKIQ